ncbi:hypothetical protein [Deinococcus phoenicis]|uniref:hypothetical protein n=1 Tax=Deinococcus phoenicis TaxID=1476583 RepID=UPI0004BB6A8E|nr:hypothetical protein [Deinococcus phoenicis]
MADLDPHPNAALPTWAASARVVEAPDELDLWQAHHPARAGRLPGAVNPYNTNARPPIEAYLDELEAARGVLAFLTLKPLHGTAPRTWAATSDLADELVEGLEVSAYYVGHLGGVRRDRSPHAHPALGLMDLPACCPICGGGWQRHEHVSHHGELLKGWVCPAGCGHWRVIRDKAAVAAYMAGPADPHAHSKAESVRRAAANKRLREVQELGRRPIMRGWKGRAAAAPVPHSAPTALALLLPQVAAELTQLLLPVLLGLESERPVETSPHPAPSLALVLRVVQAQIEADLAKLEKLSAGKARKAPRCPIPRFLPLRCPAPRPGLPERPREAPRIG